MLDMNFTQKSDQIRLSMIESLDKNIDICFEDQDRAEAERLINIIKNAPDDERVPNLAKLKKMCLAYGIDTQKMLDDPDSMLEKIPTRQQIIDIMLRYFYKLYQTVPSPEQSIRRITDTLITLYKYPEFEDTDRNEPVRTKILRRFTAESDIKWKAFRMEGIHKWAFKRMSDEIKKEYENADGRKKSLLAAKYLDDSIFEEKLNSVQSSPADTIRLMSRFGQDLKKSAEDEPPENDKKFIDIDLDENTRSDIKRFCTENGISYEGSSDLDLVCAIAESIDVKMTSDEFIKKSADFWHRLEAQFNRTMSETRYTPKKSKKTGVFYPASEKWSDRKKDSIKAQNKEWTLLEFCQNTANGKFFTDKRINRKNLYYYAIMFDMTCDLGDASVRDEKTDISKNLFEDFYCDNMLRFFDGKVTSNEAEPSGEGINYKNFTDVIYLYYLSHNETGIGGKRIDEAEKLIAKCIRHSKKMDHSDIEQDYVKEGVTYHFRTKHTNEVLDRKPDELEDYIVSHFWIPEKIANIIPEVDISNTANESIDEIMENIDEDWQLISSSLSMLTDTMSDNSKRRYVDRVLAFNRTLADLLKEKYSSDEEFLKVIDTMIKRIDSFEDIIPYNELKADCLKVLYFAKKPILKAGLIKKISAEFGSQISSSVCTKVIKDLINVGFDISISTETSRKKENASEDIKRKTGTFYCLEKREYPHNAMLQNVIDNMPLSAVYATKKTQQAFIESIRQLHPEKRSISRSRLLTAVANMYILGVNPIIQAEEDDEDFSDIDESKSDIRNVLEIFCLTADEILTGSNFQPVSPKNLFDMYLFLSALYYFKFEIQ